MNTKELSVNPVHDEVCELLPWYVNGSLCDSERARVEEHARDCIVCRRELVVERRTLDVFRNESPLDQSAQAGFERLHERIAGTAPDRPPSCAGSGAIISQWIHNLGRFLSGSGLRAGLIAAPVAILVVAFGLVDFMPGEPVLSTDYGAGNTVRDTGDYQTLSSASSAAANRDDIHVIFAPNTGPATIQALVQSLPAEIVLGPNSAGAYTLRLHNGPDGDQRQATIMELRLRNEVLFAEAAQPMAVPQPRRE